jgi:hypothetical protein
MAMLMAAERGATLSSASVFEVVESSLAMITVHR